MLRTSVYDAAQDIRVLSRHNVAHKAKKTTTRNTANGLRNEKHRELKMISNAI